jgi:hypothetical protein
VYGCLQEAVMYWAPLIRAASAYPVTLITLFAGLWTREAVRRVLLRKLIFENLHGFDNFALCYECFITKIQIRKRMPSLNIVL